MKFFLICTLLQIRKFSNFLYYMLIVERENRAIILHLSFLSVKTL